MLIFDRIWLPLYTPDEFAGGFDDDVSEDAPTEEPVASDPPSDDDAGDDLNDIVAEVADEIDDDGTEDAYSRDENGRFAKKGDDDSPEDGADQSEDQQSDDGPSEWPEHMAEWSEDQLAAFDALPQEAQDYLRDPSAVVEHVQEHVARELHAQYEPLIQQLEPLMNVLSDPGTSEYLSRRQTDLGIPAQDVIRNVLQADAVLTYSTNTQQRYDYARQLLQSYGIDPVSLVLDDGQQGANYQQQDLQQQLAQERWRREQIERSVQQQSSQAMQQNVETFATQVGGDGQPLRPMMGNPSVRASMGHLIASGQAHSLDHAYQMAVGPIEAEVARRTQHLARQQTQNRQAAVRRSARAAPVRVNTASHGGKKDGESIESIVADVVSQSM